GVMPIPGKKQGPGTLNQSIVCGGVQVHPGDVIIADEEGIVVVPSARQAAVQTVAQQRHDRDAKQSLIDWQRSHRTKINRLLQDIGFVEPV
ncbi:MAG: RraA family protein, partial [Cyanobacteria bacterium P01_A01_bin.105]